MTATPTPSTTRRELDHRHANGISVTLSWQPAGNALFVTVVDDAGDSFELSVGSHEARDAFEHPYAYAAFRGSALLDMRGNGESEGAANAFGWGSGEDVSAALDFLAARTEVRDDAIGGLGLSVGGELLLEAGAGDPRLRAVVAEGAGYRTLHEYRLDDGLASRVALPQSAILFGAIRVLSPASPPEPLDRLVPRISPRAILLIEAGHGQGGETLNALYHERAGEPKEHWLIPEASHTGGLATRPDEYERRVVGFFDRYLLGRESAPRRLVP